MKAILTFETGERVDADIYFKPGKTVRAATILWSETSSGSTIGIPHPLPRNWHGLRFSEQEA